MPKEGGNILSGNEEDGRGVEMVSEENEEVSETSGSCGKRQNQRKR